MDLINVYTFQNFKSYHYFSSKDSYNDETLYESVESLIQNLTCKKSGSFRIMFPQIEIYITDNKISVDELISNNLVEKNNNEQYETFQKFNYFVVLKSRNKNNPFILKLREKNIKMIEFEKISKVEENLKEFYFVAFGKKIALILQYFIDFVSSASFFFEIFSDFEFLNSSLRKINFEVKKFTKGAAQVSEKWSLSEKFAVVKGQDKSKYRVNQESKVKKEMFLKQIDLNSESLHGIFIGCDFFGKNLVKLFKYVLANNSDYKIIVE